MGVAVVGVGGFGGEGDVDDVAAVGVAFIAEKGNELDFVARPAGSFVRMMTIRNHCS